MTKLTWGFTGQPAFVDTICDQVDAGWKSIVLKLIDDLLAVGWDGKIYDCKEKFGGLRFYIGDSTDTMDKLVSEATSESYKTCEVCGQPGRLYQSGWWKTLCPEHAVGRGYIDKPLF